MDPKMPYVVGVVRTLRGFPGQGDDVEAEQHRRRSASHCGRRVATTSYLVMLRKARGGLSIVVMRGSEHVPGYTFRSRVRSKKDQVRSNQANDHRAGRQGKIWCNPAAVMSTLPGKPLSKLRGRGGLFRPLEGSDSAGGFLRA